MSGGAAMGVLLWLLIFLGAGAAAPLALAVADARVVAPSRDKINLVVVLGDDFGSYDGAAYRGGSIRTPTVDALVSQGLLMDSFYVFQICSPTRSALVSGRYPFHVSQALPEGFHAISRQYELLPALLKRSGNYRTYHVGKWRESNAPAHALARNHVCLVSAHSQLHASDMGFFNESYTPHGQGFDHSFGFLCACHDVNHWNEGGHFTTTHACTGQDIWTEDGPAIGRNGSYSAELYGQAAVDFVLQHAALAHASSPMYLHRRILVSLEHCSVFIGILYCFEW